MNNRFLIAVVFVALSCKQESQKKSNSSAATRTCLATSTFQSPTPGYTYTNNATGGNGTIYLEGSAALASYSVQQFLQSKCVSCHSPTGSRPNSPMSTAADATRLGSSIMERISRTPGSQGFMPPGQTLAHEAADMTMMNNWRNAGFPDWSFSGTSSGYTQPTNPYGSGYANPNQQPVYVPCP